MYVLYIYSPTLAEVLTGHSRGLFPSGAGSLSLPVRRNHIWEDTKKYLHIPLFNWTLELNVTFCGEPAEDGGGPRREFFRLAMIKIFSDSSLFQKDITGTVVPVRSTYSLRKIFFSLLGNL